MKLIEIKILIKQLFFKHYKAYMGELYYGDAITWHGGKRQGWYCSDYKKFWCK